MIGVFPVGPLEPDPDEIRSAPVDVDALDKLREAWAAGGWPAVDAMFAVQRALPDLIAEVRRGRALREAVEGLAERFGWDTMREPDWTGQQVAEAIRAALAALDPS